MSADAPPLPAGYTLAHRFTLTQWRTLVWMNVIGSLLFVLALAVTFAGLMLYDMAGAPLVLEGLPDALPVGIYLLMVIATMALHEALHGLAILACGYRPSFGAKISKLVLYTTSDAYFTRAQYLFVTLLPLLGITLLGIPGMLLLPRGIAVWVAIMVALNAASSIGDLWMAAVTASFPPAALFHDEADGMSVFLPAAG